MPRHDKDIPAEKVLFDAADQLRGSVESAEYKHLVLGLVFLKYVSDGFAVRPAQAGWPHPRKRIRMVHRRRG